MLTIEMQGISYQVVYAVYDDRIDVEAQPPTTIVTQAKFFV